MQTNYQIHAPDTMRTDIPTLIRTRYQTHSLHADVHKDRQTYIDRHAHPDTDTDTDTDIDINTHICA